MLEKHIQLKVQRKNMFAAKSSKQKITASGMRKNIKDRDPRKSSTRLIVNLVLLDFRHDVYKRITQ